MNLMSEGLDILKERGIKFVDRFVPYFLASYGAHHFNLVNRKTGIYKSFGRVPDTRLQILFTAPPGWSKSLLLKQLLHSDYGLVNNNTVPVRFMGSCTEAGWTGSSDGSGINMVTVKGIAQRLSTGIAGMEEFAAIQAMMESTHSSHLEQALAMSLFEGDVEKDLKGTTISYHTDISLWAGNQIMNFDLSGGLFRRFFHVYWTPRLKEAMELERAVWDGDNIKLNDARLTNYRAELARMSATLHQVKSLEFTNDFKRLLSGVPHFEKNLYKSFGIGYSVMKSSDPPRHLVIDVDEYLDELVVTAIQWRRQLLADPRGFQVESLMYDLGADQVPVKWSTLRERNLLFSVSYTDTDFIVATLLRASRVKYDSAEKTLQLVT
jgi:hypothetical protein